MKVMILAAGRGERMGQLTAHCPKPLLKIDERPLIEHHIRRLVAAGCQEIVINLCYLGKQIETYLGDGKAFGVSIQYSWEEQCLETGGGIQQALTLLGEEPFMVLNGDVWTDYPLQKLLSYDLSSNQLAHLILVDNPTHNTMGDFNVDSASSLVTELGPSVSGYTFAGISVLSPKLFAEKQNGCYPLAPLLRNVMVESKVSGEHYGGVWVDVGTPERFASLNEGVVTASNEGKY
ncbi:mannose-1-phosphate guanylyltransferase [Gammaproteobacteria bacterium 45_16_T64]|nr:mannose-1-phosphate guanylyltransferase [Gammaproteobacteria bacterium 45_16_T64]